MDSTVEENREKRVKTGGRSAGTPNKITRTIKEGFILAFELTGGAKELAEWAKRSDANRRAFYAICGRFIPIDITSNGESIVQYVSKVDTQGRVSITPTLRETTGGDIQPVEVQPN